MFAFDRAELSTFFLPLGPPHLTLALTLLMLAGRALVGWVWGRDRRQISLLLLITLCIGLLNPFSLVSLLAIVAALALSTWRLTSKLPLRGVVAGLLVGLASAPFVSASLLTFGLDPFWSLAYGSQNVTSSPPLWVVASDLGPLILLAVAGLSWNKASREARLTLLAWAVVLLALMYLPVPYQRRFGFGLQPVMAVLAAMGVARFEHGLRARLLHDSLRRMSVAMVLAVPMSGAFLAYLLFLMASLGTGSLGETIFEPRGNVDAASWLATNTGPSDVVLSSLQTGNYLGGRIPGRVVVGHGAGTLDVEGKESLVKAFFDQAAAASVKQEILVQQRVSYVVLGERERALGGGSLSGDSFTLVFRAGDVGVYSVGAPPS